MKPTAKAAEGRLTHQIPLTRLERLCRSIQEAMAARHPESDLARIWRLYTSAECPKCGIWVSGDELRALALPPCPELGSAKIGRMRLGDCARCGCDAWHYSVYFWDQEDINWEAVIADAKAREVAPEPRRKQLWVPVVLLKSQFRRLAVVFAIVVLAFVGKQLYFGGRIPWLRESEKFQLGTADMNDSPRPVIDPAE